MAYESQGGTWREMITKETFVKALQLIQEQQEINHQFAKALDLVGDGHYVFGVNNKFYDAAMLVLKEAVTTNTTTSVGGCMRENQTIKSGLPITQRSGI